MSISAWRFRCDCLPACLPTAYLCKSNRIETSPTKPRSYHERIHVLWQYTQCMIITITVIVIRVIVIGKVFAMLPKHKPFNELTMQRLYLPQWICSAPMFLWYGCDGWASERDRDRGKAQKNPSIFGRSKWIVYKLKPSHQVKSFWVHDTQQIKWRTYSTKRISILSPLQ